MAVLESLEESDRMKLPRPYADSPYMEFAKLYSSAKFNLATSGVMSYPLLEIHFRIDDLEITGPSTYGYTPLLETIGELKGVKPESIVTAIGTSMANHLAMSALFAPGDEVLMEEPAYELMLNAALYLGAKVNRFQRRVEDNFALDPEEVRKNLTPQTKLIVITNMHNPSSSLATNDTLRVIGDMANEVGARVLVDEVYLEALHHPPLPTSFHLGPQFVVTSSLTKAYGLSGLRCGWIIAEPELAERIWQLNDLFGSSPVHIAELLSIFAIEQLGKISKRADALIETNRTALAETLAGHPALDLYIPPVGTTAFPILRNGEVDKFCAFLRENYETSVVPGVYFERPQHFRIGLGGDTAMTQEGLTHLADALHAWKG
jgi:aspartate/methionine/tyrosine aminotransferase